MADATEGTRTSLQPVRFRDMGDGTWAEIIAAVTKPLTSATVTQATSLITTVTLKAANSNRRTLYIYNASTANLYVKYGASASSSDFTIMLGPNDYYELPVPMYLGIVTGAWSAANGFAQVTEGI